MSETRSADERWDAETHMFAQITDDESDLATDDDEDFDDEWDDDEWDVDEDFDEEEEMSRHWSAWQQTFGSFDPDPDQDRAFLEADYRESRL